MGGTGAIGGRQDELLERDAELAEISALIEKAVAGTGSLLVLDAPAGHGKTRLLTAARERASAAGLEVLTARGGEFERDIAFGIARQLFEAPLGRAEPAERGRLLSGAVESAAPVIGFERPEAEASGPPGSDSAFATMHGLYWLAANFAERTPLLVCVDDLHWADSASLGWILYLVRRLEELPALLAVAVREGEPGASLEPVASVVADPLARVLRPAPLSETAVGHIVRRSVGEAHEDFCAACYTASGGNPFLLGELLDVLVTDHVPPTAASAERVRGLGPRTISRATMMQLARLPPGAEALARAVAVLGPEAEFRRAAAVAELDDEVAATAADALAGAGILAPGRPLAFAHPIVRAAIYEELPEGERALTHRRAARLLADEGAEATRVASQLLFAEPASDRSAVAILSRAARMALAAGATEAALTYLRRALEEPPPAQERAQILLELGTAEYFAGDEGGLEHLSRAAELAEEPSLRARALGELGRRLVLFGRIAEAAEATEKAITAAETSDPELARELEAELISRAQMGTLSASVASERLARFDRDSIQGSTRADRALLAVLAYEALRTNEQAELVSRLGERALGGTLLPAGALTDSGPLWMGALALLYAERFEFVEDLCAKELANVRVAGSPVSAALVSFLRLDVAYRCGALRDAQAAVSVGGGGDNPTLLALVTGPLVDVLLELGDHAAAAGALDAAGVTDAPREEVFIQRTLHARGMLRVTQGRTRDGLADLLASGHSLGKGSCNTAVMPWRSNAALAHALLGESDEAQRLADEELALARAFGAPRALGIALRAAGLVAGGERGIELLDEAVSVLEHSAARLELARALVDQGAAMRRAGRRSDAREPLRRGLDLADRCGALVLAARAREELAAAGARPRRASISGIDALTPSERRVARLAADGMANRDIAQALFVTVKTVETHLGHAYQKLDIGSRDDLASALRGSDVTNPI